MTTWRPQILWLPVGGFLGAVAGALTGIAMLATGLVHEAVTPGGGGSLVSDIFAMALVGTLFGGVIGAGTGLLVAVPLVFLVGRHLPRPTARRRALVLGAVLPPLCLVAVAAAVFRSAVTLEALVSLPSICSAVLGAPLAWWAAGLEG